jgi:hypothetical protein
MNYFILSLPRSGSSYLTRMLLKLGKKNFNFFLKIKPNHYELNKDGYYENTFVTLLNDQLIRLNYGLKYSFLYPPSYNIFKKSNNFNKSYSYDLDDTNVFIPKNYSNKLYDYTGFNWDVWGLSRMQQKKKWHKIYEKYNLKTFKEIKLSKIRFERKINALNDYVIKDPRFLLTFKYYNLKNFKIILINRDKNELLKSLRRHYGKNIFTKKYLPESKIVSNHFNHKIGYISYSEFCERYNSVKFFLKKKFKSRVLDVNFNRLIKLEKNTLNKINDFIK